MSDPATMNSECTNSIPFSIITINFIFVSLRFGIGSATEAAEIGSFKCNLYLFLIRFG